MHLLAQTDIMNHDPPWSVSHICASEAPESELPYQNLKKSFIVKSR